MSGGGLMQLVAYGAQDIYLTGNAQVTFFKQMYKRHTNFAMQSVEAQFQGNPDFGRRVSLVVPRVGDLMGKTYLRVLLPALSLADGVTATSLSWVEEVGHFLIDNVEIQVGGQQIDKHYGMWLSIWNQLTLPVGKKAGYSEMVEGSDESSNSEIAEQELWVPLQFWFCRHEGLALPLIALQYHEVRIVFEFERFSELYSAPDISPATAVPVQAGQMNAELYIDYYYLDTEERRKMAQTSHEYLIDQLQFTGVESFNNRNYPAKLNFNHPVKELVWVILSDARFRNEFEITEDAQQNSLTEGTSAERNPTGVAKLQFNGHDRFSERNGMYFNTVQPYQHHTNIPENFGINVYSFALYPELEQPSGTANFSRIDNATLQLSLSDNAVAEIQPKADPQDPDVAAQHYLYVYAVNYNIMRIMAGMGGLAYSN